MPKDHLFPPLLGASRIITLTADIPCSADMLGAIVSLAGFELTVSTVSGYGFFVVVGPGDLAGDVVATLTGNQAVFITLVDGVFYLVDQPEVDIAAISAHVADNSNPHAVTKAQIGLGNVNDTADSAKPVSTAQAAAIAAAKSESAAAAAADATTKADTAQAAAIAAATADAASKAGAAQAAAIDQAATDAAILAAAARAAAEATASADATAKAGAVQAAAAAYTDAAVSGLAGGNGLPVIIISSADPRPGVLAGLRISGFEDENLNRDLQTGAGLVDQYPARVRNAGQWWSSDGNTTAPATGSWMALYQMELVASATTTLDALMPPASYFAGTLAALTDARNGLGATADYGTDVRIGSTEFVLVEDGGPKWVIFSDDTNADQGAFVVEEGAYIYLYQDQYHPTQGFVAGLAKTWEESPSTQWRWQMTRFVDGGNYREPRVTGVGSTPATAVWGTSLYAAGSMAVANIDSVPSGSGLCQFLRYGDAAPFDYYIWSGSSWDALFSHTL